MLKGDLLESQSWLRCSPTCAGQDVAPNSNLAGATLILYLNLLTHICGARVSRLCHTWVLAFESGQVFRLLQCHEGGVQPRAHSSTVTVAHAGHPEECAGTAMAALMSCINLPSPRASTV